MASRVVGSIIVDGWTILDLSSDPLTAMSAPGDIDLVLHRESSGAMVAAGETVTWAEVGATGRYYFSFTPENSGLYILYAKELDALSMQRTFDFRFSVVTAGATFSPTFDEAYCAETDMERWLQQAIDGTTAPTDTEAAAFAEGRASVLTSLCGRLGKTVTPDTVTAGTVLEDLLREANAIGAALDYTIAQQFGRSPSLSERPAFFQTLWEQFYGDPTAKPPTAGSIEMEIRGNLVSLASDHILSGDTTAAPVSSSAPTSEGIGFKVGDVF